MTYLQKVAKIDLKVQHIFFKLNTIRMKSILAFGLVLLAAVRSEPVGQCTRDKLEQVNQCFDRTMSSSEAQALDADIKQLIPQCIPSIPTHCAQRAQAVDACWRQLLLDLASDNSLSVDDKYKTLTVFYRCLPRFPKDLYRLIGETVLLQKENHGNNGQNVQSYALLKLQNDTCTPDAQQLACIIDGALKNQKAVQQAEKILDEIKKCYQGLPQSCQFEFAANQNCQSGDLKSTVDKYNGRLNECVASKGF